MVNILYGPMVSEARGSTGGQVFSRNRGGAYVRQRTKPVNPQSPAQETAREAITAAIQGWTQLTTAAKEAWNTAAKDVPPAEALNRVGQSIVLTGQQFYVRVNAAKFYATTGAFTLTDVPPAAGVTGRIQNAIVFGGGFDVSAPTLDIAVVEAIPLDTDEIIQFYLTYPKGPGSQNTRVNELRLIGELASADSTANANAYIARYGLPPVGAKLGVGVRVLNTAIGTYGPTFVIGLTDVIA